MRKLAITMTVVLSAAATVTRSTQAQAAPELSDTRMLRRLYLAVLNRTPTIDEYEAGLASIEAVVDDLMERAEFEEHLIRWAHEFLPFGSYDYATTRPQYWGGTAASDLGRCADETLHAGALGIFSGGIRFGDPRSMCDESDAPIAVVEPWWAPGTSVRAIGRAGNGLTELDGESCALTDINTLENYPLVSGCGCGPHLLYCARRGQWRSHARGWEGDNYSIDSGRRSAFDEPARMFARLVTRDRDFSEIILGNTTMVNRAVYHLYVRTARNNPANAFLDDDEWWREFSSDDGWMEVAFSRMHPQLLDERDYRFDPRSEPGEPRGVPSAGVLTSLAPMHSFSRERVRAARWLETFACREFSPPPADVEFSPYVSDPGREGSCVHCHQLIDPAAIHFKRFFGSGGFLAGVGPWNLSELRAGRGFRGRAENAFLADSLMTPVSQVSLDVDLNRGLIDFLPPETTLLNQASDGTIGPLGFAKMLMDSGEFDRCVARRTFEHFMGRRLDPGLEPGLADELTTAWLDGGRRVKAYLEYILTRDSFRTGF